nr:uncharacterized protein LOC103420639 [Malus domestica]
MSTCNVIATWTTAIIEHEKHFDFCTPSSRKLSTSSETTRNLKLRKLRGLPSISATRSLLCDLCFLRDFFLPERHLFELKTFWSSLPQISAATLLQIFPIEIPLLHILHIEFRIIIISLEPRSSVRFRVFRRKSGDSGHRGWSETIPHHHRHYFQTIAMVLIVAVTEKLFRN